MHLPANEQCIHFVHIDFNFQHRFEIELKAIAAITHRSDTSLNFWKFSSTIGLHSIKIKNTGKTNIICYYNGFTLIFCVHVIFSLRMVLRLSPGWFSIIFPSTDGGLFKNQYILRKIYYWNQEKKEIILMEMTTFMIRKRTRVLNYMQFNFNNNWNMWWHPCSQSLHKNLKHQSKPYPFTWIQIATKIVKVKLNEMKIIFASKNDWQNNKSNWEKSLLEFWLIEAK